MTKLNYPRGLVRYDTQNGLSRHLTRAQLVRGIFRPRVLVYGSVLLLIAPAVATSFAMRIPFRVDGVRDRATRGHMVRGGGIENVYRLQIMNAAESSQAYTIRAEGLPGVKVVDAAPVVLGPAEARWVTVALQVPVDTAQNTTPGAHTVLLEVDRAAAGDERVQTRCEKSTFLLPR